MNVHSTKQQTNLLAPRQEDHVVQQSKDIVARLVDGQNDSAALVGQFLQSLHHVSGGE